MISRPRCILIADQISTVFWVGFAHFPSRLEAAHVSHGPTTRAFHPTQPRNWLIDFWLLDLKWIFVALPVGFLVMLLFYYDHVRARPLYFDGT